MVSGMHYNALMRVELLVCMELLAKMITGVMVWSPKLVSSNYQEIDR